MRGASLTAANKAKVTPAVAGYAVFRTEGEAEKFRDTYCRMVRASPSEYEVATFRFDDGDKRLSDGTRVRVHYENGDE